MDGFKPFADKVNQRFLELAATGTLFKVNVDRGTLWSTYQAAYPAKDNPIFRERRVHECNTCYSFIKRLGAVVSYTDGKMLTIWDIEGLESPYKEVAAAMHTLVSTHNISSIFLTDEKLAGREFNIEENEAGDIKWDHFYADIDQAFISQTVAAAVGEVDTAVSVFKRALEEFSVETLESAIDLCESIYRGTEFQPTVEKFLAAKTAYETSDKSVFCWLNYNKYPAKIRNSAIGTLLIDLQAGEDLETAVAKYEAVVSPANYKRTTAVVTPKMRDAAIKEIHELGYAPSLPRRHATLDDIPIKDVLFSNIDAQKRMQGSLEELFDMASTAATAPKGASEVHIDEFLATVLPGSSEVKLLVENKHIPNFVSLVAPVNPEAPSMLKWNNNFSWSYNGEVTDSMKERVKAAGGKVDGDLNFRLQWNEDKNDGRNDLDLHCKSPQSHIYFSYSRGNCGGKLDVDVTRPKDNIAVENITWQDKSSMPNGTYLMYIHNYSGANKGGFRAQIEFADQIFEYNYPRPVRSDVHVATVTLKNGTFTIEHHLVPSSASREVYGTDTLQWKKVSTVMLSPNFWEDQAIGNKHFFFMLEDCKNPDSVRGFYNEFLLESLKPHRKAFELLSSKMKCPYSEEQLSGLGFSSSQRNTLNVKVDGRPYTLAF